LTGRDIGEGHVTKPPEYRAGESQIAALQVKLLRAKARPERQRLLDQIFVAEERFAPISTELFNRARTAPRKLVTLRDVQRALRADEVLLEFAVFEPASYCLIVTRGTARLHRLPGRAAIQNRLESAWVPPHSGQMKGLPSVLM
jgi:hypothetical protein